MNKRQRKKKQKKLSELVDTIFEHMMVDKHNAQALEDAYMSIFATGDVQYSVDPITGRINVAKGEK